MKLNLQLPCLAEKTPKRHFSITKSKFTDTYRHF
jgi:hypothetical protein